MAGVIAPLAAIRVLMRLLIVSPNWLILKQTCTKWQVSCQNFLWWPSWLFSWNCFSQIRPLTTRKMKKRKANLTCLALITSPNSSGGENKNGGSTDCYIRNLNGRVLFFKLNSWRGIPYLVPRTTKYQFPNNSLVWTMLALIKERGVLLSNKRFIFCSVNKVIISFIFAIKSLN